MNKPTYQSDIDSLFREYIEYCTYTKKLRPKTISSYKEVYRHFRATIPDVHSPTDLTHDAMQLFFKKQQTRERVVGRGEIRTGIKASTVHTYGSKLHSFFEWLVQRGSLERNPIRKRDLPTPVYDDKKELEHWEIHRLYAAVVAFSVSSFIRKRDKALLSTLLFTGVRRGELLGIRVCDVDLDRMVLNVRAETSKSKSRRQIPLGPHVLADLEDYISARRELKRSSEYLWVAQHRDAGLTEDGLIHWVRRLKIKSGVRFHLHQFRHTFACLLSRKGVDAIKVQKLLGHTDIRMTAKYLRSLGVEDLRSSIEDLTLEGVLII